jgi:PAS domain S-box-containing protein
MEMGVRSPRTATLPEAGVGVGMTVVEEHSFEQMKARSALMEAIFNSAYFWQMATDAEGVIQIFNVGAEAMLGYDAVDVVDRITPADISDPAELIKRAAELSAELDTPIAPGFEALVFKAKRGIEDSYELTYVRKDGSRFPAIVSVTALRNAQDDIIGYLLIGTDNTAGKARSALSDAIFSSAYYSQMATDAAGVIQIFNVGAEAMLGYDALDVVDRITPADISDPGELIKRAAELSAELDTPIAPGFEALVFKAKRGIEDIYELTYVRKDGSRFPAIVSVTALRDAQDDIIGYLLIGTDNTAAKARSALSDAIVKSAYFWQMATDAAGVIQIFNVGAEAMLGYDAVDVVDRITPADISDPEELIKRAAELSAELDTPIAPGFEALVFKAKRGMEDSYELTYVRKDGSRFPAIVSVTALPARPAVPCRTPSSAARTTRRWPPTSGASSRSSTWARRRCWDTTPWTWWTGSPRRTSPTRASSSNGRPSSARSWTHRSRPVLRRSSSRPNAASRTSTS